MQNTVGITVSLSRTNTSCPLKLTFSGTVLASAKPPQACHGKEAAINWTDIIRSDGWGGDRVCGCVCVCVCLFAWLSATITCTGARPRVPAMSTALCEKTHNLFASAFIWLRRSPRESKKAMVSFQIGTSEEMCTWQPQMMLMTGPVGMIYWDRERERKGQSNWQTLT